MLPINLKNNRCATAIIFSAVMVELKGGLSIGSVLLAWILGYSTTYPSVMLLRQRRTFTAQK